MAEEARRNDCPLPKGRGKDVKLVPTSRPGCAPSPQRAPEAQRRAEQRGWTGTDLCLTQKIHNKTG